MQELNNELKLLISKLLKSNEIGDRRLKVRRQFKNVSFRNSLFNKFDRKCNICGADGIKPYITKKGKSKNNPLQIHHKKYDWKCPYEKSVTINCKQCYAQHKDIFEECLNNCVLLCDMCHYKLHYNSKMHTGNWI